MLKKIILFSIFFSSLNLFAKDASEDIWRPGCGYNCDIEAIKKEEARVAGPYTDRKEVEDNLASLIEHKKTFGYWDQLDCLQSKEYVKRANMTSDNILNSQGKKILFDYSNNVCASAQEKSKGDKKYCNQFRAARSACATATYLDRCIAIKLNVGEYQIGDIASLCSYN